MIKKFFLLKNFQKKFSRSTDKKKISKILKEVLNENNQTIKSLSKNYLNSYKKNNLADIRNFQIID